ncbi:MAG TPA: phosphopantetheine-binding protein [Dehalococcoidia bacterium]|nr:phosphopantetheine-binding protein [Dehalococcoidia bacterium]
MTETEIRTTVLRLLGDVAPEADMAALKPDKRIRDQIDIDSMDALNFLIAIDAELGIDIPEADYPKMTTLDNIVAYLSAKAG